MKEKKADNVWRVVNTKREELRRLRELNWLSVKYKKGGGAKWCEWSWRRGNIKRRWMDGWERKWREGRRGDGRKRREGTGNEEVVVVVMDRLYSKSMLLSKLDPWWFCSDCPIVSIFFLLTSLYPPCPPVLPGSHLRSLWKNRRL